MFTSPLRAYLIGPSTAAGSHTDDTGTRRRRASRAAPSGPADGCFGSALTDPTRVPLRLQARTNRCGCERDRASPEPWLPLSDRVGRGRIPACLRDSVISHRPGDDAGVAWVGSAGD